MQEFLESLIPTSTEAETGTVTAIIGSFVAYLCGWDDSLEALLVLMALDYLTGVMAAYVNTAYVLSSKRGFRGICKKVMVLAVVALAHELANMMGQEIVRSLVIWFFAGNEGLSILENAVKSGIPVPNKLKDTLEQLRGEKEIKRR